MAAKREDITLLKDAVAGFARPGTAGAAVATAEPEEVLFSTPFDYLFPKLATNPAALLPADDPAKVVAGLKALGDAMVEDSLAPGEDPLQPTGNSTIPPVYTYWGQFVDHDLTANTDRDSAKSDITKPDLKPLPPADVVKELKNLRQPTVNLDSVYGDGPTFDASKPTQAGRMYDGIKLRVGKVALNPVPPPEPPPIRGVPIPPDKVTGGDTDPNRDLPRIGPLIEEGVVKEQDFPEDLRKKSNFKNLAFIADARNDENLIIAQFHTAVLRFHNAVVEWVTANEPNDYDGCKRSDAQLFERAQQLTRWHYQWLVVNDFLKTVTLTGIVDKILLGRPKHYAPRNGKPYMPLEFSVAAYRFGHTMVRAAYDHNRNFGRPAPGQLPVIDNASFDNLFFFTGNGDPEPFRGGTEVLPFNWIIEWERFTDKASLFPDHFARKIDTRLAPPLRDLVNQGNAQPNVDIKAILKRLARRNLLRGYLLSIPTGQSVAKEMEIAPLSANELRLGNSGPLNQVLQDSGFLERTPLWFYVLKEAEVRANGNSLGDLGSRIVCETIIGQLLNDPESYLKQQGGWDPSKGVKLPPKTGGDPKDGDLIVTIRDFLRFAGLIA
ncbi:MAG: heme peroxidase family protein [Pseudomonadota bacterium]|nr:heme peroxidase family protein [Pseudomonadota bacterium]